jgi:IS30 family transposase
MIFSGLKLKEFIMPIDYSHLNLEKRSQAYALRATKTSTGEIAPILQCGSSSITRELKRNTVDSRLLL